MNYFKTVGGALILVAVIGLETLFSAGIWYMLSVGMYPALGSPVSGILAFIVAPIIGMMALVMFVYGHRLKGVVLEWEAANGSEYDEEHEVYYNKHSYTAIVDAMRWIVLIADTAGILYRILQEQRISIVGQILLFIVFEALAVSPWLVGTLVHIVAHRPAAAIRRDVQYTREVIAAQSEMRELIDGQKRRKEPKTARVAGKQAPALQSPKETALPTYQASQQSEQSSVNGKR